MKDEPNRDGLEIKSEEKEFLRKDELDELDFEEWEEAKEDKSNPAVTILTFAGLVILAAIICAILWHFTHLDRDSNVEGEVESSVDVTEESVEENMEESTEATLQEPESKEASLEDEDLIEQVPEESVSEENNENVTDESIIEESLEGPAESIEEESLQNNSGMQFAEVSEEVTAKDVTNLRSNPSTSESENVVAQLKNGEVLSRTGINTDAGWSRLLYNGEVVYAVTQYLTTDLSYKTPVKQGDPNRITTQDGRIIIFEDCNDNVTPKEYVNLRTEPSTSQGEATVRCQIRSGEVVHRTGYSPDAGWSRVEYNGEILYVVSSYVKAAQ